jgi:hypothetical protein
MQVLSSAEDGQRHTQDLHIQCRQCNPTIVVIVSSCKAISEEPFLIQVPMDALSVIMSQNLGRLTDTLT